MHLRHARPEDAAAIAAIYNHAVEHTTAIWNDATVDADNRVAWMADRQRAGFPVRVAVDAPEGEDGEVVGYATYGPWRTFDGYRHTVEHSVYVREDQRGRGLGRCLLEDLVESARDAGVHVMVAGVEAGNAGSIRLHEHLGFIETGRLPQVGCKFGRWLDLVLLQKTLDSRQTPDDGPGASA